MSLSRAAGWERLCAWTETASLRKHARAVELVMRAAALRYGAGPPDVERWGLAGLLHDADYEKWPEDHPRRTVAWLQEQGEPEIAHAVSAHYTRWGVAHESPLDRALLACDELTGFVVAAALVRPEGIATLEPRSIRKKLKDRAFAAKVDRGEIEAGTRLLGVPLDEHVAFVIEALRPHAAELGIAGAGPAAP
jgi:predicted hydrolase (HD superfamily)